MNDMLRVMLNRPRTAPRIIILSIGFSLLVLWTFVTLSREYDHPTLIQDLSTPSDLPCRHLPGANDTVVILRTGSTELEHRLPIHLSTTLRCFSEYLIFSDHEETFGGEAVHDVLQTVSENIRTNHPDFDLYRRLQQNGRAALHPSELSGSPEAFARMNGNVKNPGWKLDKWKFMPMLEQTWERSPDKKWYVFIEADTLILWSMLLQYLALLNHTKPHYSGSQMFIDGTLFAHGGSAFIISNPGMQMAVEHYRAHKEEIEAFTDGHWAGDCVLGKYVREAGVPFTSAWPHFQGDYPGLVPYAKADGRSVPDENLREWCYPTVSYHHMSPSMIRDLWEFEQRWLDEHDATIATLRHGDIFTHFVMPQMFEERMDWDNLSDHEEGAVSGLEECRAKCEAQPDCKQYSLAEATGQCRTRVDLRLGKEAAGVRSDWIQARVISFQRDMMPCGDEGWVV